MELRMEDSTLSGYSWKVLVCAEFTHSESGPSLTDQTFPNSERAHERVGAYRS
jgi:hypothetical protein